MKTKKLDWLATEILSVYEENNLDPCYIENKRQDLLGKDRLAVLRTCSSLDERNLHGLAKRLTLTVGQLNTTLETLKKL